MRALVLVGPTGVGKTDLSIDLAADRFEIISFDSVQVYRFLNIGSGKPDRALREAVPHHLIDIVDPEYPFNAGDFCRAAPGAVENARENGRLPLFVGGTGLYIDSFMKGIAEIPEIDPSIREKLAEEMKSSGTGPFHETLVSVDPGFAATVHPNDRQRILRGLEVFHGTGIPLSEYHRGTRGYESEFTGWIGLREERSLLIERIERRVDAMMEAGFVDEVAQLRERGYGPELKSMNSIGYAEINRYLDGEFTLGQTVDAVKINTRRYAKRQMTWFRKNNKIRWFAREDRDKIREFVIDWLDRTTP